MNILSVDIYNLRDLTYEKQYPLNPTGLNIILGQKRDEEDEANGVGKTTMVEVMNYLLGSSAPEDLLKSKELAERDVFLILKIRKGSKESFLGRRIIDSERGYILDRTTFTHELKQWEIVSGKTYKNFIQELQYDKPCEDIPSFSALREYVMRDEKKGFNDITLPNREAKRQYKYLSYLFRLPHTTEDQLLELKNPIKKLKDEMKLVNSMAKTIDDLKIRRNKIEREIQELSSKYSALKIGDNYKAEAQTYSDLKSELSLVQRDIFKNEQIAKQYRRNIDDLSKKITEIRELNDIDAFYSQLIDYFPDNIVQNRDKIVLYYDFMIENRGKYFGNKLSVIESNLEEMYVSKRRLLDEINKVSSFLDNNEILEDIAYINDKINEKNLELANINAKIAIYDQKSELNKKINKQTAKFMGLTNKLEDEFSSNSNQIERIVELFNELLNVAYKEEGILEFEFENRTTMRDATGRVKIKCKIEDEKSHGRLYMKINIFDLTWFIMQLDDDNSIDILVHDGSYCKPDKRRKVALLKHVDTLLKLKKNGQYFITLNMDELATSDLEWFRDNKLVPVELDRSEGHKNRFFGFKYS